MRDPGNMVVTMHYLISPQVLLLFQKEKEEETASCKTQIIPPSATAFGLRPRFCSIRIKMANLL